MIKEDRARLKQLLLFIRNKEEGLVLTTVVASPALTKARYGERPSDRAAKLLPEPNLLPLERVLPRQIVIAEQVKPGSVKFIGSRFRCQVDNAAGGPAELGRECAAEHLELLQRLHRERR